MVQVDWTINIGNVIAIGIFVLGIVSAHINNTKNLAKLQTKLDIMFEWFERNVVK